MVTCSWHVSLSHEVLLPGDDNFCRCLRMEGQSCDRGLGDCDFDWECSGVSLHSFDHLNVEKIDIRLVSGPHVWQQQLQVSLQPPLSWRRSQSQRSIWRDWWLLRSSLQRLHYRRRPGLVESKQGLLTELLPEVPQKLHCRHWERGQREKTQVPV